jgi:hypothetical protein
MRRLLLASLAIVLGCTSACAAWKYGSGPGTLLPAGAKEYTASITNENGLLARFSCNSLSPKLTFFAQLEPFPGPTKRKLGEGPPTIDSRVSKVKASWAVDGAKGKSGTWKKAAGILLAEGATARAIFDATLSANEVLTVTSGRGSQSFSVSGSSKALAQLAKVCK